MDVEKLIKFETAKLAKEKGFSLNTTEYWQYNPQGVKRRDYISEDTEGATWVNDDIKNRICVVNQSLLQLWLRGIHKIFVTVDSHKKEEFVYKAGFFGTDNWSIQLYTTYEEALEAGLFEGLKLIK